MDSVGENIWMLPKTLHKNTEKKSIICNSTEMNVI